LTWVKLAHSKDATAALRVTYWLRVLNTAGRRTTVAVTQGSDAYHA
jgi:hypothetical protein